MARRRKNRRQDASALVPHQGAPPLEPWMARLLLRLPGWLSRAVSALCRRFSWAAARSEGGQEQAPTMQAHRGRPRRPKNSSPALVQGVLPSVSGGSVGAILEATGGTAAASSPPLPASDDAEDGFQPVKRSRKNSEHKAPRAAEVITPKHYRVTPVAAHQSRQVSDLNKIRPTKRIIKSNKSQGGEEEEEEFYIGRLFHSEAEIDAEREAHERYGRKAYECKGKRTFCLACHLKGREEKIEKDNDKIKYHCQVIHKNNGFVCGKAGCLARAANRHDKGVHELVCHGM